VPWRIVLQAVLLVVAALFVYQPAVNGDWLMGDDTEVAANYTLRDPEALGRIWLHPTSADYLPVKTTAQWLFWRLWDANASGYHWANIVLHALSALLFWRVLWQLNVRLAWWGALLLIVHPLTLESVAWISALKNALSLPLLLGSFLFYLAWDERRRLGDCLIAVLFFALAMLSSTAVVMFPLVLLLYCWWKHGGIQKADGLTTAPFFCVSVTLGILTLWYQANHPMRVGHLDLGGAFQRLATTGTAVLFYLWKGLMPIGLMPIYPPWPTAAPALAGLFVWPVLIAAFVVFWRQRTGWGRHVLLGFGFFVLNVLPVAGLMDDPFLRFSGVADHFAYLPLLGLFGLAAAGLEAIYIRLPEGVRRFAVVAPALAAFALAFYSRSHAAIFQDRETYWTYAIEKNPGAWAAYNDLGYVYFRQGHVDKAVEKYHLALQLNPDFPEAKSNLGIALVRQGHLEEAIALYQAAIADSPRYVAAINNLGNAFLQTDRLPEAIQQYTSTLNLDPDLPETHFNLAVALSKTNHLAEAGAHLEEMVRLQPDSVAGHFYLARLHVATGNGQAAVDQMQHVLALKPEDAEAHRAMGDLLMQLNRPTEAVEQYATVVRLRPNSATARFDYANRLLTLHRGREAIEQYEQADKLQPNYPELLNNYGLALVSVDHVDAAVAKYRQALALKPDYAEAHNNLGISLLDLGQRMEAIREFQTAVTLRPGYADAMKNLEKVLQGDPVRPAPSNLPLPPSAP
jgi:tetratricopeptide (TPR) repeat protein